MEKIGLVLEGGGMRGVYTAGVLDFFLEQEFHLPYVIGVSAGACHAASYISRQHGRNKKVNIGFIRDPRYLSYRNLLQSRSLFGMDFIFNEIPNKLVPFDYNTFYQSPQRYVIGTTNCQTGEPVYFNKEECGPDLILKVLMASSSLPFVSPIVNINGLDLLDGGITDPIPINRSMADGNEKHLIVLTRPRDYRKTAFKQKWLAQKVYRKYDGLVQAMVNRHQIYNNTLDLIENLEQEGKAIVLRPSKPIQVDRLEKNVQKLNELFALGYQDASSAHWRILEWIDSEH